jgi:hypothetical protein
MNRPVNLGDDAMAMTWYAAQCKVQIRQGRQTYKRFAPVMVARVTEGMWTVWSGSLADTPLDIEETEAKRWLRAERENGRPVVAHDSERLAWDWRGIRHLPEED